MPEKYLILACDGGGIRGNLTAQLIAKLNDACEGRLLPRVNLFAGTSTGGIIALCLAKNVAVNEVVDLYSPENAARIFQKRPIESLRPANRVSAAAFNQMHNAINRVTGFFRSDLPEMDSDDLVGLFATKYENTNLKALVSRVLGERTKLTDLRRVMVTTFRLDSSDQTNALQGWEPVTLDNFTVSSNRGQPFDTLAVEAAMCTSAAPTYFEPYPHAGMGALCVDGGLFANNPGALAVSAAMRNGVKFEDIVLLSFGTGGRISRYPLGQMHMPARFTGKIPWMWPKESKPHKTPAVPLLAALMDGSSEADRMACQGMLGDAYRRVQVTLDVSIELDDVGAMGEMTRVVTKHTRESPTWHERNAKMETKVVGVVNWARSILGLPPVA